MIEPEETAEDSNKKTDHVVPTMGSTSVGMHLHILRASTDQEIDAAFNSVAQYRIPALAVMSNAFFNTRCDKLVAMAARNAVPAMYSSREHAAKGGLISYGMNLSDLYYHKIGIYTAKI